MTGKEHFIFSNDPMTPLRRWRSYRSPVIALQNSKTKGRGVVLCFIFSGPPGPNRRLVGCLDAAPTLRRYIRYYEVDEEDEDLTFLADLAADEATYRSPRYEFPIQWGGGYNSTLAQKDVAQRLAKRLLNALKAKQLKEEKQLARIAGMADGSQQRTKLVHEQGCVRPVNSGTGA